MFTPRTPWRRAEDGAITLEFALWLPVLLLWLAGGTALFEALHARHQANRAAETVVDVLSHVRAVDTPALSDVHRLTSTLLDGRSAAEMTMLSISYDGRTHRVDWHWRTDERGTFDVGRLDLSGMPVIPPGSSLVVAQVRHLHRPLILPMLEGIAWEVTRFATPRHVARVAYDTGMPPLALPDAMVRARTAG
ncbi:MAG: TadE/TadG family type IV pilus assembly protein [Pseudomonadota bacterium]